MKVELDRTTATGNRSVLLIAHDVATNPATLRAWIKMLQLALRWLENKK